MLRARRWSVGPGSWCGTALVLVLFGCMGGGPSNGSAAVAALPPAAGGFSSPQRVTITGYSGDAMEPFITRDGKALLFNDSNGGPVTKLYWASRIDDRSFQFQGAIGGVNGPGLDAVPSMDDSGNLYFISNRSYDTSLSTLYQGTFRSGSVSSVTLVPGISLRTPGIVTFDAEVSADGGTMYVAEGPFAAGGTPRSAQIVLAHGSAQRGFVRDPQSASILKNVNTVAVQYAPATSVSGLEMLFTRLDASGPGIYDATRPDTSSPFGTAVKIDAISGFSEAPSITSDGKTVYYHHRDADGFHIYCVTRTIAGP